MGRVGAGVTLAQVKANVKLNELQAPDGTVALNSQKLSGLAAGTAQNDSMRKGQAEVALADLVAAVCSETEADGKITSHAGAVDPHADRAYADGITKKIATGSYVGNTSARQITVGFKCSCFIIGFSGVGRGWTVIPSHALFHHEASAYHAEHTASVYLHASDGLYLTGADANGQDDTHYYLAISE